MPSGSSQPIETAGISCFGSSIALTPDTTDKSTERRSTRLRLSSIPVRWERGRLRWSSGRCLRASGTLHGWDFSAAMITWSASLSNTSVSAKPARWTRLVQPATEIPSPMRWASGGPKSFVWS